MNWTKIFWIVILSAGLAGGFYYRYRSNAADARGATLLMRSFEQPTEPRQMMRLIKHTKDMNEKDKAGQTALFYAVRHSGDVDLIRKLFEAGANPASLDNSGRSVLMVAVRNNPSLEILEELLLKGAPVNAVDKRGNTALLEAAEHGTPGMMKLLLRAGANPDVTNNEGQTVAELLAKNGRFSQQEKDDYRQALLVLSILGPR